MKQTVRLLGLCALVALAATSCQKNEETNTITGTLTQPTYESKTHVGANSDLEWNANDQIKVFDATGASFVFTNTASGTLQTTFISGIHIKVDEPYVAFYPAVNATDLTEGYVYLTLPATQTFVDGSFANNTYPMAAYNGGTGTAFTFHSPCGMLDIPITGDPDQIVGSIELTGKNAMLDRLAGQLKVNPVGFDPSNPTATHSTWGLVNHATTVTLNCGTGVALSSSPTHFVFVLNGTPANLPAVVLKYGFTAVVKAPNGNVIGTLSTTKDNHIISEKIRVMPTSDFSIN